MVDFTPQDLDFMRQRGSDVETVKRQFSFFEKGFDYACLDRAATLDDGILQMSDDMVDELVADYSNMIHGKKVVKFVPASGAASRMFKELYSYLTDDAEETKNKALNFLQKLPEFPFYEALAYSMQQAGLSLEREIQQQHYQLIVKYLLEEVGLNYGNQPKGLLLFHQYDDHIRTAVEEHLVEAARYACNDGQCFLHFTVSPQHQNGFNELLKRVVPDYERQFGVRYHISFSIQNPATDTLAAELDNMPFRDENGVLFFRPGGHGALIHNLNEIDADLVFVKNIDNVIKENNIQPTIRYKKALAAYLLQLQNRTFHYLKKMENDDVDEMLMCEMLDFAESELMITMEDDFTVETLFDKMNRPIRVCGMVKNEGEPGGGPFWVLDADDNASLQIVESSQINQNVLQQKNIMTHATYFNPVDMVCAFKDFHGNRFQLTDYIDERTGYISVKSYGDRKLKAIELPGLWNGAMSNWITVFVEVPIETFNPVKTVFDLLKRIDNPD